MNVQYNIHRYISIYNIQVFTIYHKRASFVSVCVTFFEIVFQVYSQTHPKKTDIYIHKLKTTYAIYPPLHTEIL